MTNRRERGVEKEKGTGPKGAPSLENSVRENESISNGARHGRCRRDRLPRREDVETERECQGATALCARRHVRAVDLEESGKILKRLKGSSDLVLVSFGRRQHFTDDQRLLWTDRKIRPLGRLHN